MATQADNAFPMISAQGSCSMQALAQGSPVQIAPLSSQRLPRTFSGQRKAPQSPPSPMAANRSTGRVAFGPWNGAFQPSPLVAEADSSPEQTIYMSADGHGHLDLAVHQSEDTESHGEDPACAELPPVAPPPRPAARDEAVVDGPVPLDDVGLCLPSFPARSSQRAEKRSILSEQRLVGNKGEANSILQHKSAMPVARHVFQPRRAY